MKKADQINYFTQRKFEYVSLQDDSEKKEIREEILKEFHKIKTKSKDKIKEIIYPVLRDEISYAHTIPDYVEVVNSFNQIKDTDRYKNEPVSNTIIMNNMLIKAFLFLYLDSNKKNNEYLNKAKNLLKYVESQDFKSELSSEQYNLEINNFNLNTEFYRSVENNEIWTEFTLIVPFPIGISETKTKFIIDEIPIFIETEKFQVSDLFSLGGDSVIEMARDKYGILTRTKVNLKINEYFSSENMEKIYYFGEEDTRTEAQIKSLNIINRVISRFRLLNDNYWVDNVDIKMIDVNSVKIYANDTEIKNILLQMGNTYKISNNYEYNNKVKNETLQDLIALDDNEVLWLELLADAKNYLLINKLREAIISLNSSFENFFYSRMKEIFYQYEDKDKIDAFFKGEVPYSKFKEIIDEDTFSRLKKEGVFTKYVPSVYQLMKRYYLIVPENKRVSYTKRQMGKSINTIKKYRNDIVHGNLAVKLSNKHVYDAINEFEELSSEIEKYHHTSFLNSN